MIRLEHLASLAGAFALTLALGGDAQATGAKGVGLRVAGADKVACTVRAMHGLEKAGGIDKRLKSLKKKLSRPPFSPYKTIKLLQAQSLTIAQSAQAKTTLPDGKALKLVFKEKLLRKGQLRLRMHLTLTHPKTKKMLARTIYSIADGGTFLLAGAKYKGGITIVGVTCKAQ